MRKCNVLMTVIIFALFIVHAVCGSLNLMNIAPILTGSLARVMLTLILIHAVISIIFTVKSIMIAKKTGAPYFKENRLFWARRISGFVILLLVFFHITAFGEVVDGVFKLSFFSAYKLTTQLLLVLSVGVHIITNVKPVLISLGIRKLKPRAADILFFISIILALASIGFIVYFIRWNFV